MIDMQDLKCLKIKLHVCSEANFGGGGGGGGGGDDSKPSVGDRMGDAQIKTRRR